MPEPINSEHIQTEKQTALGSLLTGVDKAVPMAWEASAAVARSMQFVGNRLWRWMGGPGSGAEKTWNKCSEEDKTTAKRAISACAGAIIGGIAYEFASNALSSVPGVMVVGTIAAGLVTGLGAAGYSCIKLQQPLNVVLFSGATVGTAAAIGIATLASPALVAGLMAASVSGSFATATTRMALTPNHLVVFQMPMKSLHVLATPNEVQDENLDELFSPSEKKRLFDSLVPDEQNNIPLVKQTSFAVATKLQTVGKRAWQFIGGPGSDEEKNWMCNSEEDRISLKRWVSLCAGIFFGAIAFDYATTSIAIFPGIISFGTLSSGISTALSATATSWTKLNFPMNMALHLGAKSTNVATLAKALFFMSGATATAFCVGTFATEATHLALTDELASDVSEKDETNAEIALQPLEQKIAQFTEKQPPNLAWIDPQIELLETMSKPIAGNLLTPLISAQRALEGLGANGESQQKIDVVRQALLNAGHPIDAQKVDRSLIEKIEKAPFESSQYIAAKAETDKQLNLLVKNGLLFGTLLLIHVQGAGQENTDATFNTLKYIAQEAAKPNAKSLWSIYMKHIGHELSLWPRIKAKFCYWLFYTLDILKNPATEFATNALNALRNTAKSTEEAKQDVESLFNTSFQELAVFLEIYNGTYKAYGSGEQPGTLAEIQQQAIDRLGNLEALCQKFSPILIDHCFPKKLKIWKDTKSLPFWLRPFAPYIEARFDKTAQSLVRKHLPYGIQISIQNGLLQTSPQFYPYKTMIAKFAADLIAQSQQNMEKEITWKPHAAIQSREIDQAAPIILQTLKLKKLGPNPTKEDIATYLEELKAPKTPEVDQLIEKQIAGGVKEFMYSYTHTPEMMEQLLGNTFFVTNETLKPGPILHTDEELALAAEQLKVEYEIQSNRLKEVTTEIVRYSIQKEIKHAFKGHAASEKSIQESLRVGIKDERGKVVEPGLFVRQKTAAIQDLESLIAISQAMSSHLGESTPEKAKEMLQQLDHYSKTLHHFAFEAKALNVSLYAEPIPSAFNRAFHPIYVGAAPLAQQAIELQAPQLHYYASLQLAHKLSEITQMIEQDNQPLAVIKTKLLELTALAENVNLKNPGLKEKITFLTQHFGGIEIANQQALEAKIAITALQHRIACGESAAQLQAEKALQMSVQKEKMDQKAASMATFKQLALQVKNDLTTVQNKDKNEIKTKLGFLEANTAKLLHQLEKATLPSSSFILEELPQPVVQDLYNNFAKPLVEEQIALPYVDAAFNLITDSDLLYQGCARVIMGNVIQRH